MKLNERRQKPRLTRGGGGGGGEDAKDGGRKEDEEEEDPNSQTALSGLMPQQILHNIITFQQQQQSKQKTDQKERRTPSIISVTSKFSTHERRTVHICCWQRTGRSINFPKIRLRTTGMWCKKCYILTKLTTANSQRRMSSTLHAFNQKFMNSEKTRRGKQTNKQTNCWPFLLPA